MEYYLSEHAAVEFIVLKVGQVVSKDSATTQLTGRNKLAWTGYTGGSLAAAGAFTF